MLIGFHTGSGVHAVGPGVLKKVRETLMRKVQSHGVSLHITHTLIVLGKSVTTGNANAALLFLFSNT